METINALFNWFVKNWILCSAIVLSTLTAIANTNSITDGGVSVASAIVFLLSYSGLFLVKMAKESEDLAKIFYYCCAGCLMILSSWGTANYLLDHQSKSFSVLSATERLVSNAASQAAIAQNMLNSCEDNHYKNCVRDNTELVKKRQAIYENEFKKLNAMTEAQNKADIVGVNAKSFGIDAKTFQLYKWRVVSFFFGLVEFLFWINSSPKPLDKRVSASNLEISQNAITDNSFKKTVDKLKNRDELNSAELKVLETHEQFSSEGRILPSGLPAQPSQFGAVVFGSQGTGNTKEAIAILLVLQLISFETFTKTLKTEA
jgi:hypothetical protein